MHSVPLEVQKSLSCSFQVFDYNLVQFFSFLQSCSLKFGSWTYDATRVDIIAESESADLNKFQVNGEWSLVSFPCKRNKEVYKCCPQPYSDVTCTLNIRRRTTYFFVNLIAPCFLITGKTVILTAFLTKFFYNITVLCLAQTSIMYFRIGGRRGIFQLKIIRIPLFSRGESSHIPHYFSF